MASKVYDNIRATAEKFLQGYDDAVKTRDTSPLSAVLSPSCWRYLAPASLFEAAPPLAAGFSNAEYEKWMKGELDMIASHKAEIKSITVDEVAKKAVIHAANTSTNSKDGRVWAFEFVWFLDLNEDGTQVEKVVQFVDTGLAGKFLQAYNLGGA